MKTRFAGILVALCSGGLLAGWSLFRRTRMVPDVAESIAASDVTVIVPARNEAANLPRLLSSLQDSHARAGKVIVVDDESEDATAEIAQRFGATVHASAPRPVGWLGKPWACWQGAKLATTTLLLFLDADTRLAPAGLGRLRSMLGAGGGRGALSVLPWHGTSETYEELSLIFNLLMAAAAGGFGLPPTDRKLFGQMLLIGREAYLSAGGHAAVRGRALEALHLAPILKAAGVPIQTALGMGVIEMRMFPEGLGQLCASWRKGFADGASSTSHGTLMRSILWLAGAASAPLLLCQGGAAPRALGALFYAAYAGQLRGFARRVGSYCWVTSAAYPVPLLFYFGLFTQSLMHREGRGVTLWKGRPV